MVGSDLDEATRVAELAAEVKQFVGPRPERERWPAVSIVVPTRDGRTLLARLLQGLAEHTRYPDFEVIVVDNASSDGTLEWLQAQECPFALTVVRNARNYSFAMAVNIGASRAAGELLLVLNNDVEPIEDAWLRRLVMSLDQAGAVMAGAVLVDPNRESVSGRPIAVQHDGIAFRLNRGVLRPVLLGLGSDVSGVLGPDGQVAAVAAACALVRRTAFEQVGGFSEGFGYGSEDVDLCLRLASRGGAVTMSRSAVLVHRPMSTRRGSPEGAREAVLGNHRLLLERWGPAIRREYALDRSRGRHAIWNGDGGVATAKVSYCVKPGTATDPEELRRVVADIESAGRPARSADGTDAWLLDDVVVHLFDGIGRHALTPGRLNVLFCRRGEPAAGEAAAYDIVVPSGSAVAAVVEAAETALRERGGPRRAPLAAAVPERAARGALEPAPRVVVVLGMARSGTSATMRILNILGVAVGDPDRLLGAIEHINKKGFFEHYAIMRLNTALLRRLGGSWRDPPPMPSGWESDPKLDDLREQAAAILAADFAGRPLWGFKDPRTCLTLPFWRPLIGPAAFVVCHRHPLEIAASLETRDGLSTEQSIALWRRYTAAALASTVREPRTIVGYDDLLDDPPTVVEDLAAFLGRPGRARSASVQSEIHSWLDRGLRHHSRTQTDLLEDSRLGPLDLSLTLLLEVAARTRSGAAAAAGELADALDVAARRMLGEVGAGPRLAEP